MTEQIETRQDPSAVAEQAMDWIKQNRPEASPQHKAAFANAVTSKVTGFTGGFGGPSVREHAAARIRCGERMSFEEAVNLLNADDGPVFGPITKLHRVMWRVEHCFDDDPADLQELGS